MNEDMVNAGLNYGYSIIRSLISSIICAKGYLGNFGIFHRGKQNMFNLADDIIEVFRPIIDEYVYLNMRDEIIFKQKHREGLIRICSDKKIEICNQQQTIANAIYVYIEALLKVLETGNPKAFIFPLPYLYDI
ncbi:MAG: CRISPR-associated endonuclease Cas1 [Thomasclavelia sp.]